MGRVKSFPVVELSCLGLTDLGIVLMSFEMIQALRIKYATSTDRYGKQSMDSGIKSA